MVLNPSEAIYTVCKIICFIIFKYMEIRYGSCKPLFFLCVVTISQDVKLFNILNWLSDISDYWDNKWNWKCHAIDRNDKKLLYIKSYMVSSFIDRRKFWGNLNKLLKLLLQKWKIRNKSDWLTVNLIANTVYLNCCWKAVKHQTCTVVNWCWT